MPLIKPGFHIVVLIVIQSASVLLGRMKMSSLRIRKKGRDFGFPNSAQDTDKSICVLVSMLISLNFSSIEFT